MQHFQALLGEDRELKWRIDRMAGPKECDLVELDFDGHRQLFHAAYELKPSPARMAILKMTFPAPVLLVTPELSDRLMEYCRAQGLAAMDLNGRMRLRAPGLLVERGAQPGRAFRYELEPRNIFEGKSARIVRTLLTDRNRHWTQQELLSRTRASGGLVSRIVQHLTNQGYLEKTGSREFRVRDVPGLVDAWMAADRPERRLRPSRFSSAGADPSEVARRLHDFYGRKSGTAGGSGEAVMVRSAIEAVQPSLVPFKGACPAILFTQWTAAKLRGAVLSGAPVTGAYVSYLPTQRQMESLGFSPVSEGGDVWLYLPADEGVFLESTWVDDLPLTTDAQVCLDLQRAGQGGQEAGTALRKWEGFCGR